MPARGFFLRWVVGDFAPARFARSALFIYLSLAACAWFLADAMIFPRPPPTYQNSERILRVPLPEGGTLAAVHLPNPASTLTILFAHGNFEDLGDLAPFLDEYHARGWSVFAYDYRGYGTSDGAPSSRSTLKDVAAVFHYLTNHLGVSADRIVAHGRSVGAAPAVHLASTERIGGLVIESGFVSAFRVRTGWPLLPFDKLRNLARMPHVRGPVLVLHGERDTLIPPWHGEKLYHAASGPKTLAWIPGAGHNDLVAVAPERYWGALADFFQSLEKGR